METYKLTLKLEDKPGELSKVLAIIAENKGNMFAVSHLREKKKDGYVPVVTQLQADESGFNGILADLDSRGIEILEKTTHEKEEHLTTEFILIGHVIDTDIKDTVYSISQRSARITNLDIRMKCPKEPSSVFVEVLAKDEASLAEVIGKLRAVAKAKDLLLIEKINHEN